MIREPSYFRVYCALSATLLFWGLSFVVTKIVLREIAPFSLMFLRFGTAALLFQGWLLWRGRTPLTLKQHGILALLGLVQPWLYFLCETFALQYTSAAKASLILASIPVFVLLCSARFLGESIDTRRVIGAGMSVAGVVLLTVAAPGFSFRLSGETLGDVLMFGAVGAAVVYTILLRFLGTRLPALTTTAWQFTYGTLFFLPWFLKEAPTLHWSEISSSAWLAFAALTLFATIVAFFCYSYALCHIPASRGTVFLNGIPLVTVIAAWAVLGETLNGVQLLGGGMVLLAVWLANRD